MIVYLDTSALVKAYIDETGTDSVIEHLRAADIAVVHEIAYVEARAAYARLAREKLLTPSQLDLVKQAFESDWPRYAVVGSEPALLRRAADLAEALALRAYDSVHLAAAEYIAGGVDEPVTFLCFDRKLCQAASVLRLHLAQTT
ncbi:MAG: type II toxin-antitoxin system VapC family toxin [Gammaproteobacteria bacterium]|nr:type II toxin-antitoxin system VapC family toxin [Gammaproteobacteria bacterium]